MWRHKRTIELREQQHEYAFANPSRRRSLLLTTMDKDPEFMLDTEQDWTCIVHSIDGKPLFTNGKPNHDFLLMEACWLDAVNFLLQDLVTVPSLFAPPSDEAAAT